MPSQVEPIALRLSEVAALLGVSKSSVNRLIHSGELPSILVGSTWRVLRRDFEAYVDRLHGEAEARYARSRHSS